MKSEMIKPATSHIKTMANDSNLHSADTDVKYSEEKVDRMSFPHGCFAIAVVRVYTCMQVMARRLTF